MKELLEAVYARPDDDGPRAVLADWLQERGDPWGEFIQLQLRRTQARASARETQLVTVHGKTWAGPLNGFLKAKPRLFRRGFLASAELPLKGTPPDEPAWATLEALDLSGNSTVPRRLRAVRELLAVTDGAAEKLAALDTIRPRAVDFVLFYEATIASAWKAICASPVGSEIESVSFRGYAKVAQYLDAARPPKLRQVWCWPDGQGYVTHGAVRDYVAAHPELTVLEVDDKGRPIAPRGSGTPAARRRRR